MSPRPVFAVSAPRECVENTLLTMVNGVGSGQRPVLEGCPEGVKGLRWSQLGRCCPGVLPSLFIKRAARRQTVLLPKLLDSLAGSEPILPSKGPLYRPAAFNCCCACLT